MSLRVKRSSLVLFGEIAAHLAGARNDMTAKGFLFLNRDLGFRLSRRFLERYRVGQPGGEPRKR
jgi:hypothetical protein